MTCRLFTTSRATCRLVDSKVSGRRGSTWRRNNLGADSERIHPIGTEGVTFTYLPCYVEQTRICVTLCL